MSELERFRDHCREMAATGAHLPDCKSLRTPAYTPPTCDGCVPENDRALFARLAAEVDEYLTPDDAPLWGDA